MEITFSGYYDTPTNGLGRMTVQTDTDNGVVMLDFTDAHTAGRDGQSLQVGGGMLFKDNQTNVTDRRQVLPITVMGASRHDHVLVRMGAHTAAYPYTPRFIKGLAWRSVEILRLPQSQT